jgi:hypothetical protein
LNNQKDGNMSWYGQWILAGIYLGYKLWKHHQKDKVYYFINAEGEYKKEKYNVHRTGVKKLVEQKLVEEKVVHSPLVKGEMRNIVLTPKGFDLIHDKIKALTDKETSIFVG